MAADDAKRALNRDMPVLAVDSVTDHQDHVVVVTGYEGEDYIVLDPALFSRSKGIHRSRWSRQDLRESSGDEFYAPRCRVGVPKRRGKRIKRPV